MKKLSKTENLVFRTGALLMIAGAVSYLAGGWIPVALYVVGVLMFVSMQARAGYEGNDFVIVRLRRQQMFGAAVLVLSAVAMVAQQLGHTIVRYNEWVICLLIGAVIQLYTAFRLPSDDSENTNGHGKTGVVKSVGLLLGLTFIMSACSEHYSVTGTTTVHGMEGKMLYLKVYDNQDLKSIDSCVVMHGKFAFNGKMDSTMITNLFLGNQSLMPVVVEEGNIVVKIDEMAQLVSGTPLNDSLYNFIQRKTQIDNQLAELPRKEGRMVMDGMEHDEVIARLALEAQMLTARGDQLETSFIKSNYNNVLGFGLFMILTSEYAYPVLTPQIEEIMVGATPYFLNHPYVAEYLKVANENMEKLQQ
ncbi:MAG: DUF4369 domain-containing protein [Bacteroidaceae bacterium]|nr:DUF4369 domain-containing protein [Bacteroidaceae bacterium]